MMNAFPCRLCMIFVVTAAAVSQSNKFKRFHHTFAVENISIHAQLNVKPKFCPLIDSTQLLPHIPLDVLSSPDLHMLSIVVLVDD